MFEIQEGLMPFKGYKTYYKIVGTQIKNRAPLIILHGGPGSNHNYLLGLSDLAKSGRQIIFYDQLGGGKSSAVNDDSLWTYDTFLEELSELRKFLKLDEIHLLGHSWGGMLAIEYMLQKPSGVKSVVLASSMISLPLYQIEVDKLKSRLPGDISEVMHRNEAAGTYETEEYKKAYKVYSKHHLFREDVFPPAYSSPVNLQNKAAYEKLWGPSEAYISGELKEWNRVPDLHKIKQPSLVISGQYDELTPMQASITANELPNSEIAIITNGTHLAHIEEEETYLEIVRDFLSKQD